MKKNIYAIMDKKLTEGIFNEKGELTGYKEPDAVDLFFAPSDGVATRQFMDLLNDKNKIGNHSEDFYLVKVAEVDTQNKIAKGYFTKMLDGEIVKTEN